MMKTTIILSSILLAAGQLTAWGEEFSLSVGNVTGEQGSTVMLPVALDNTEDIRDFMFFLKLPEGMAAEAGISTDRDRTHECTMKYNDGLYKMMSVSLSGTPIQAGSGVVLQVPVTLDINPGSYEFWFANVDLTRKLDTGKVVDVFLDDFGGVINVVPARGLSSDDHQLYAPDIYAGAYGATLNIGVDNTQKIKSVYAEIQLPEGVSGTVDEDGNYAVDFTDRVTYTIDCYMEDGKSFFTGSSTRQYIAAGEGALASIGLNVDLPVGEYDIIIANQQVVTSDATYTPDDYTCHLIVTGESLAPNTIVFTEREFSDEIPANYVAVDGDGNWQANEVVLTDGVRLPPIAYGFTSSAVNYRRASDDEVWQAMYVPYEMPYDVWSKVGRVAELADVEVSDDNVCLNWQTVTGGNLVPNRPYIFSPETTGEVVFETVGDTYVSATCHDALPLQFSANGVTVNVYGTYEGIADVASVGAYVLRSGGFTAAGSGDILLPFGVYILAESAAATLPTTFVNKVNGETTNVGGIGYGVEDTEDSAMYYDLIGRRAVDPAGGVFVTKGQKVYKR